MEEKTLGRGPKDGGKEELGEEEWVSLNILSLRKKRWGFLYPEMNEREDIYSSGGGNMNGMSFNEG